MNDATDNTHAKHEADIRGSAASVAGDSPVGYGNPPRQHRFKKGESGNKSGRKKGTRNMLSVFRDVATEKIKVKIGGEIRKMTRAVYVLWANYYKATRRKDQNALNNIMLMAQELGMFIDRDDLKNAGAAIATSQPLSFEQFEALFGSPLPGDGSSKVAGKSATKH